MAPAGVDLSIPLSIPWRVDDRVLLPATIGLLNLDNHPAAFATGQGRFARGGSDRQPQGQIDAKRSVCWNFIARFIAAVRPSMDSEHPLGSQFACKGSRPCLPAARRCSLESIHGGVRATAEKGDS